MRKSSFEWRAGMYGFFIIKFFFDGLNSGGFSHGHHINDYGWFCIGIIAFLAFQIFCAAYARLILHPDKLVLRTLFGRKTIWRTDIVRTSSVLGGPAYVFASRAKGNRLTDHIRFAVNEDDFFNAWIKGIPRI